MVVSFVLCRYVYLKLKPSYKKVRPQVFASTVFVLLQRRTNPNPLLCALLPPVGLKYFFNTIDVFKRSILEKRKKRHIKKAQFTCKTFLNSPYSLCNSVSNEIIFSPHHPSLRFKRCETYLPVQFGLKPGFLFQRYLGFSRYKTDKMLYLALFTWSREG